MLPESVCGENLFIITVGPPCLLLPDVFFSLCLALMVASLLETIFITNLLGSSSEFSPVPRWIRVFVLQFLGLLVCMPRKKKQTEGSGTDAVHVDADTSGARRGLTLSLSPSTNQT